MKSAATADSWSELWLARDMILHGQVMRRLPENVPKAPGFIYGDEFPRMIKTALVCWGE